MDRFLHTTSLFHQESSNYFSVQKKCYSSLMDILSLIKSKVIVSDSSSELVQILSKIPSSEDLSRNTLTKIIPLCSDIKMLANAGNTPKLKLLKELL